VQKVRREVWEFGYGKCESETGASQAWRFPAKLTAGQELAFPSGEPFARCTFGQAKLRRNFRVSRDGW
jgi:hypothetical protein